jgi:chromosome segregation ATPase
VTRATHESALADIARHRSQIADLHDALNEARSNIDDLNEALAAEQAEAAKQFGIADDAQDRVTNLEVELKLAVETVRKLRDDCILSRRLAIRRISINASNYQPEIDATTEAIGAADRFLAPHTTPENAQR